MSLSLLVTLCVYLLLSAVAVAGLQRLRPILKTHLPNRNEPTEPPLASYTGDPLVAPVSLENETGGAIADHTPSIPVDHLPDTAPEIGDEALSNALEKGVDIVTELLDNYSNLQAD